ncbi:hypothetical protein F4604DRAFT_309835 [Suillus subluteus]|nr:hypothetical protein F4604DRAFT_309835 [Suillus subluteus]
MKAMDRVHRVEQNQVVNVYRLITKGTLEEKIMSCNAAGLQSGVDGYRSCSQSSQMNDGR